MTSIKRYTPTTLLEFNTGERAISNELEAFLSALPAVKSAGYLNSHNTWLYAPPKEGAPVPATGRKPLFARAPAFTDEKIVTDVRALLGKVSKENFTEILDKLTKMRYNATCWPALAEAYHHVLMECLFLSEILVDLLLRWTEALTPENAQALLAAFDRQILMQLQTPRQFDDALDDVGCQNAADRARRWQIANAVAAAHLFARGHYTWTLLEEQLVNPVIKKVRPEETFGIDVILKVIPLVAGQLTGQQLAPVMTALTLISTDHLYPTRLRFVIMDLLENPPKNRDQGLSSHK